MKKNNSCAFNTKKLFLNELNWAPKFKKRLFSSFFLIFFEKREAKKGQILFKNSSCLFSLLQRALYTEREIKALFKEEYIPCLQTNNKRRAKKGPSVDLDACASRLKSLYKIWNSNENQLFNDADALLIGSGANKEEELRYLKAVSLQIWLFSYELPDTVIAFINKGGETNGNECTRSRAGRKRSC